MVVAASSVNEVKPFEAPETLRAWYLQNQQDNDKSTETVALEQELQAII